MPSGNKGVYNHTPKEWMERAQSNLHIAKIGKTHNYISYDDLGNNCHAAAEKALKALLISQNCNEPEKTHDLNIIITELEKNNIVVPNFIKSNTGSPFIIDGWSYPWSYPRTYGFVTKTAINDYAVDRRYPGDYEKINENGYKEALKRAEMIFDWVESKLYK